MILRKELKHHLERALKRSRVVALIGPRQCGKTTLARQFVSQKSSNYFDLENPISLTQLDEPMTVLEKLKGLVVIDEVQLRPNLFPLIRVLADRTPLPARFLILGSASPDLLKQSSESLAGRLEIIEMSGFSLKEVGVNKHEKHWLQGGFPLSFLARSQNDSFAWRRNFIHTFITRDLPQHGVRFPASILMRFWTMAAHYHGQIWNAAEPSRSLGVSESTSRHYLDILEDVFMVRLLKPWHTNLKKRQVKSPKIYFRDTGILHSLLGIKTPHDLLNHPKYGSSWEGYIIEEIIRTAQPDEAYFWATHNGAELDLLIFKGKEKIGFEVKRADAPRLTPSMRIALEDLKLKRLLVVYPGEKTYSLEKRVTVLPLNQALKQVN